MQALGVWRNLRKGGEQFEVHQGLAVDARDVDRKKGQHAVDDGLVIDVMIGNRQRLVLEDLTLVEPFDQQQGACLALDVAAPVG